MIQSATVAAPYSIILIMDSVEATIPASMNRKLLVATDSCIAVGCKPDVDGETEIVLGSPREIDPGAAPLFDGFVATPSRTIVVMTATESKILQATVATEKTPVKIWVNDPIEPDRILVGIA